MLIKSIGNTFASLLPGFFIGSVSTSLANFFTGLSGEFFAERARKSKHKIDVARHVSDLVGEVISSKSYTEFPRDMEKAMRTVGDLKAISHRMAKKLERFLSRWQLIASCSKDPSINETEKEKTLIEWRREADTLCEELSIWVSRVKAGKRA